MGCVGGGESAIPRQLPTVADPAERTRVNEQLLADLESPATYPHEVHGAVRIVQTHISVVALTGLYAYKIKKPVDLGFVDFSTLEKRRHYCNEELRLNARFSPDIYLDVAPMYRVGQRHTFAPGAPASRPVEYAVRMHEFDPSDVLTEWIDNGRLTSDHIEAIARKIARIHADAPTSPDVAKWGEADAFEAMLEENFDTLRAFAGSVMPEAECTALRDELRDAFRRLRTRLQARAEAGFVRECHGDLHLRNLCWFRGDFHLFDCIEFNDAFRCIDVLYELAFLAMDLRYRKRPDLAQRLINVYLERTGDYEGAVMLPFFMAVRASIRGKVACLRSEDPDVPDADRAEARESARQHLALARELIGVARPAIVLVCGVAGSGKSTVARELAQRLGALHLRSDAVRKHQAGVSLDASDPSLYTRETTRWVYRRLADLAEDLARAGWPVILDATFLRASQRRLARDAARSADAPYAILHLDVPADLARERIANREGDVSDAYPELVAAQQVDFEPVAASESAEIVSIDARQPIDRDGVAARVRTALGLGPDEG